MTWWRCSGCGRFAKPDDLRLHEAPTMDLAGNVELNESLECPDCDGRAARRVDPGWRFDPLTGTFRI